MKSPWTIHKADAESMEHIERRLFHESLRLLREPATVSSFFDEPAPRVLPIPCPIVASLLAPAQAQSSPKPKL